jgi:hypothetical protein
MEPMASGRAGEMKVYNIALSARRSFESDVEVMDQENKDDALRAAEAALAKSMGCEVSELLDVNVERCLYIDPNEEDDMGPQKRMKGF